MSNIHDCPMHIVNFISVIYKQYLYRNRCLQKRIYVEGLKQEIEQTQDTEYFIACKKNHINKWYIIVRIGVQSTHTY